ncbi:MAG: phospho-N-acetylmuramoyl-pentapeptide-transferase [Chthoniobacterales bacterium]
MLYYLYRLSDWARIHGIDSDFFKALNVFQYITFRAISAAITSFLLCLIFGDTVIRHLISLKFGQPIRTKEEVHALFELHGAKKGTPTMGGILLLGAVIISTLLWAQLSNPFVWLALFTTCYLGVLGFADDWMKVTKKNSRGISSRLKFGLQCVLAVVVTIFFLLNHEFSVKARELYIPFLKDPIIFPLTIGTFILAFIFYLLIIVGTSNGVNLTDGLDGLAIGCTISVAVCYALLCYIAGNIKFATYLQLPFYPFAGEMTVICMALAGAGVGFLWWNCHPARVFMGDTGSLAIGGLLAVIAICCKQELLLVVVGGIFVIETLSVILQVISFKTTGKRILKMSPLHHHFELSGWKESTVIVRFWIMSIIFALMGLATLKLR